MVEKGKMSEELKLLIEIKSDVSQMKSEIKFISEGLEKHPKECPAMKWYSGYQSHTATIAAVAAIVISVVAAVKGVPVNLPNLQPPAAIQSEPVATGK